MGYDASGPFLFDRIAVMIIIRKLIVIFIGYCYDPSLKPSTCSIYYRAYQRAPILGNSVAFRPVFVMEFICNLS